MAFEWILWCVFVLDKVVNTVPAGMYRTGMYTGIETSTFRTGLNTGRTGHVPANFGQYRPIDRKSVV